MELIKPNAFGVFFRKESRDLLGSLNETRVMGHAAWKADYRIKRPGVYAVPVEGWWGFSALNSADFKLKAGGQDKDVELGAVIWVEFHEWRTQ